MEEKKQTVEAKFKEAMETAQKLLKEIGEMRMVDLSQISPEEQGEAVKLAKELDERTAYILRGLLIPFGGVLFL